MGRFDLINRPYHRDRSTCSIDRNAVQPARAKTSSGALHKSMINSRRSGIPRFHGARRIPRVGLDKCNIANTVIYYDKRTIDRNV